MWDLWWIKWHWDRFFSDFFGFPQSIYHSTAANMSANGSSSDTQSHPIIINQWSAITTSSA
jgi:hypothetical protein